MNKLIEKRIEKLIAALRSGKYLQQTEGCMKDQDGRYDVLGVACEVSKLGEWKDDKFGPYYDVEGDHNDAVLPVKVQDYYGFSESTGTYIRNDNDASSLAMVNDSGDYSFDQMADLIEYCLENPEIQMFI